MKQGKWTYNNEMRRFQIPMVRGNGWKYPFCLTELDKKEWNNDNGHDNVFIVYTLWKAVTYSKVTGGYRTW